MLTVNKDGSYTYICIHSPVGEAGSTAFTFRELEYLRRSELNAVVEVLIHHEKMIWDYSSRINLESASAKEGFVRALQRITKSKKEFDAHLNEAITALKAELSKRTRCIRLVDAPPKKDEQWLLEPFILDKSSNIIFGEGGGGKTFVALRWLLSIATGVPFLGIKPRKISKCLFLDYEDSPDEGLDRIYKLCGAQGMNVSMDLVADNIFYINAEGVPLHDLVPMLKETIAKHEIEFILLDSAALACGGEPEKADSATRYFNAMNSLGITSLTIAHETKTENHDHVFGSIFWRNSARNIWNGQSETDEADSRKIAFGLFHRKCNHSAKRRDISLQIFHGEGYVSINMANPKIWESSTKLSTRIVGYIGEGGHRIADVYVEFQSKENSKEAIRKSIERLMNKGTVTCYKDKGDLLEIARTK